MTDEFPLPSPRLIEAGFPCHQVGAETARERDTGQSPPTHRLHVWWARRPLTPSRAAILAALLPADADPETFVRRLGIERRQALIHGVAWTLTGKLLERIEGDRLAADKVVLRALEKEQARRRQNRELIARLRRDHPELVGDPVLKRWEEESRPIPEPWPREGEMLDVVRVMGDPAWAKERIDFENTVGIRTPEDKYHYPRAYTVSIAYEPSQSVVLDPTAGGGSIPFEALRLGHRVIANELNPVATVILHATLDYPARFGPELKETIEYWGRRLLEDMRRQCSDLFPASPLSHPEGERLGQILTDVPEGESFLQEILDGFIHCRQVTCPHCGGEAPLLNTFWLSKEAGDRWGVKIIPENGQVRFATYRVGAGGRGPNGEDPNGGTVHRGVGQCVHCRQAIDGDEIKRQARGESPHGKWRDRLYAVVAVRLEPELDAQGKLRRFASGPRKGEIRTRKVRYFRPPNDRDLKALAEAERRLRAKWPQWEREGLIPKEPIPTGQKTSEPLRYGMTRWCDLFTPRQLLGHLTLIDGLRRLTPEILAELGEEKGRAVVTYLQFAIDKGLDYNSRQTRWHYGRGVLIGTFGRRLTDKKTEAVANPARDGGAKAAKAAYEDRMAAIFAECRRVLKDDGLMTLMFTHKSQDAWETLTRSLMESGWVITACWPVESEGEHSMHQKDMAAAASSIFLVCRKRPQEAREPALWESAFGQTGVRQRIEAAVRAGMKQFAPLRLNPVDEMVACYGKALEVLSAHWPVVDGDDPVSPIQAMNEGSRVVAQARVARLTGGRVRVAELDSETALALPEERAKARIDQPQTDWDRLCGLILAFREGDVPVARAYLAKHAEGNQTRILDLLDVWGDEARDPERRCEARALRFGLGGGV